MNSTKDIYLAAAWLALGARHERTDKTDTRHMEFFFSPRPVFETGVLAGTLTNMDAQDLDRIERDWVNGCVMVNAVQYKDALQRLKAVIHSK